MIADLKTYINALGGKTPTAQVLGSEAKRNLLNKFLGVRNVRGNPLISPEYKVKEGEHPWRAFRLDRIIAMKARNEATPTRFSQRAYEQAQGNFSPAATDVDQLGMYSKAERAIKDLKQERGTGQQFMAALEKAGVKQEEIAETGLGKFLEDNPKTTKEDVLNHLEANTLMMQELVRGGERMSDAEKIEMNQLYREHLGSDLGLSQDKLDRLAVLGSKRDASRETTSKRIRDLRKDLEWAKNNETIDEVIELQRMIQFNELVLERLIGSRFVGPGKFGGFTMPGADKSTYRERLLTKVKTDPEAQDFTHRSHFSEPNIIAHIRHTDRKGPNGERVLFIEEVQSDWHQQGRKRGYKDGEKYDGPKFGVEESLELKTLVDLRERNAGYYKVRREIEVAEERLQTLNLTEEGRRAFRDYIERKRKQLELQADFGEYFSAAQDARLEELINARHEVEMFKKRQRDAVPDAPFKKSWPELSMKRMLRVAAEEGYDAIAWTTGKMQNERYQLSKFVSEIRYEPTEQRLTSLGKDGQTVDSRIAAPDELPDVVGKELADRLLQTKTQSFDRYNLHILKGVDLEMGGSGMKGFYDNMLPKLKAWKQVKGADGKQLQVEMKALGDGKIHYVALDETAKNSILDQGLPRFSPGSTELTQSRSLNDRGGAIYTNERGDRAIQLSSRSGVRVYSDRGKRIGPVFSSVEKAQDYLRRR
jgi:hypothetical protein